MSTFAGSPQLLARFAMALPASGNTGKLRATTGGALATLFAATGGLDAILAAGAGGRMRPFLDLALGLYTSAQVIGYAGASEPDSPGAGVASSVNSQRSLEALGVLRTGYPTALRDALIARKDAINACGGIVLGVGAPQEIDPISGDEFQAGNSVVADDHYWLVDELRVAGVLVSVHIDGYGAITPNDPSWAPYAVGRLRARGVSVIAGRWSGPVAATMIGCDGASAVWNPGGGSPGTARLAWTSLWAGNTTRRSRAELVSSGREPWVVCDFASSSATSDQRILASCTMAQAGYSAIVDAEGLTAAQLRTLAARWAFCAGLFRGETPASAKPAIEGWWDGMSPSIASPRNLRSRKAETRVYFHDDTITGSGVGASVNTAAIAAAVTAGRADANQAGQQAVYLMPNSESQQLNPAAYSDAAIDASLAARVGLGPAYRAALSGAGTAGVLMPYGFDVDVGGWTAAHELGPEGPSRDPRWIHGKEMEYWRSLVYASGVPTSIETSADVHMFECYHPEDLTIDQALRRIRWQTASIRKFWAQDRPLAAILQTCNPPANSLVAGRPYSPEFFRAMVEELVRLGVQPVLWANPNGRAVVSVIMPSLVSLPATWSFNIQIAARSATVVVTRPGTVNATTIAEATRAAVQAAFAAATPVAGSVRAGLTPVTLPTLAVTNRNVGGETYIDLRATDTYPPDWQPFYTLLFNGSASGRGDNGWGTVVRTIVTSGDSSHPSATDDDWALGAFAPTLAVLRTVFESGVSRSPRGARDTSARESVIATTSTPPGGRSRARNRRRR